MKRLYRISRLKCHKQCKMLIIKHMKKLIFFITLIVGCCFLIPNAKKVLRPYLKERLASEFTLNHLARDVSCNASNQFQALGDEEFHYIGHGDQAIAFANKDETYILKFFLYKKLLGEKRFPVPTISIHKKRKVQKQERDRQCRLIRTLRNYSVAFEKLKEKTGIISFYWSPENQPTITLVDWKQKKHQLDLNSVPFVLQRKAVVVSEKLNSLHTSFEKEEAISLLKNFIVERTREGFIDTEQAFVSENYGFIDKTPVYIDLGRIEYHEEVQNSPEKEIQRMEDLFSKWAKNH